MSARVVLTPSDTVRALESFGAACATLRQQHASVLPAPLVLLVDAVHTFANITAIRLAGRNPGAFNLACEQSAWDGVLKAWLERRASVRDASLRDQDPV